MPARLLLVCALGLSGPADDGDDQYHFISGLAEKGLHTQVVREAARFLAEHRDHPKADLARYRLATALFDLDRLGEAREHFALLTGVRGFRFDDEVAFRLGQCHLEAGADAPAAEAFEQVLAGDAEYLHTPARFLLGEAYFRADRYRDAADCYEATLATEGGEAHAADALQGLAWCALRLTLHDDAARVAALFIRRHPDDPRVGELRFVAGEAHLEAGRAREALAQYDQVEGGSFHAAALRGAGFAGAALGDHELAAGRFEALLERYPESPYAPEAALHRGIHLLETGDAAAALAGLSLEVAGDGALVHYWRGRALASLGRHEDAVEAFDAGLERRPDEELSRRLRTARGDALFDLGRLDDAAAAYQAAGTDYARHAAAIARLNEGQAREALRLAAPLVDPERASPYRLEATLTVAEGLFALGRYRDAEEAFAIVIREDEDPADRSRATARIGWCRYLSGDASGARESFQAVLRQWPAGSEAEEAGFMAARTAEEAGETAQAAAAFRRYLEAHPEGEHVDEALLRLARLEEGTDGEQHLVELLETAPDSHLVPRARFELAERLAQRGKWAEATRSYTAVLEEVEKGDLANSARYGLGWCLYSSGDFEAALAQLEALATTRGAEGDLVTAALELAVWAGREARRPARAAAAFRALSSRLDDGPRRFEAARIAAEALVGAERLPDAEALYLDLLERSGERSIAAAIRVELTYLALDRNDPDAAEVHVAQGLELVPDDPDLLEALFFVGEARFDAGADGAAVPLYDAACASPDPEVAARAAYKLGFTHLRRGDWDGAVRALQRLVNRHPESELCGESLFLLGEAHFRAGRHAQAAEWLSRLLEEAPRHQSIPKGLYRLGVSQVHLGRWREAAQTLARLQREASDFPHAIEAELWRGRALVGLDQRRGARAAFQRVAERDRGQLAAQAHIELGRLALAEGDREEALSKFLYVTVLFACDEEVAEALVRAGQVLESKGDLDAARERYREALADHPKARFTRVAKERLEALDR